MDTKRFSKITDSLWVSAAPKLKEREFLEKREITHILTMNVMPISQELKASFKTAHYPWVDWFFLPQPMKLIHRAALWGAQAIDVGGVLLVHCRQGRHRSVAAAGCVLVAHGMTAQEAIDLLDQRRAVSDPRAPHVASRIEAYYQWKRKGVHHGEI